MTPEEAALWYAQRGWPVIPLYSVRNGRCTCRKAECGSAGKHPRTKNGLKDASTDARAIGAWWRRWLGANVGIVTGAAAGVVAIDIDPRNGGDDSLSELQAEYGELPVTVEALTGGGGRHLFFAHPGVKLAGKLCAGIDVKADGGYVVAAPSMHASGGQYRWRDRHGPHEREPAPLPDWLRLLLCKGWQPRATPRPADNRPGADFNRRGDVGQLLTKHGWQCFRKGDNEHWTRPGKANGTSATLKNGVFYVFTTNASPFEANHAYLAFAVFALLECSGDYERAAQELSRRGFGEARVTGTEPADPGSTLRSIPPFIPFPTDVLPEPVRSFVAEGAQAIGCDPSYIALPMLAALASAIGNSRRIQLKRDWAEPAIIWTAIVGESGTLKTPAFKLAVQPIRDRQNDALKCHEQEYAIYWANALRYEKALGAWKRDQSTDDDPPEKPQPPPAIRYIVSDTTVEALAPILQANPRGVLLARDELAGWIGSFDRYAGGKGGADAAHWLSMHAADAIIVDRKSGHPPTIYVRSAGVSVTGGVQPGILDRVLGCEHRESGLLARLLLARPPRRAKRWTEAEISVTVVATVHAVFDRLVTLQPDQNDDGDPCPRIVALTPEAKRSWVAFYNTHGEEQAELRGDLSAARSKLEGYAARLALVVHLVRWAAEDRTLADADCVDEVSITAGVTLSRWFGQEARRIYALWNESEDDRDRRQLVELIQSRGGVFTPRDLMRASRAYPTASDAEAALDELVQRNIGRWEHARPGPRGGKPSKRFVLSGADRTD